MYIRRRPRRNLFVDRRKEKRNRLLRLTALLTVCAAITTFLIGGLDGKVQSQTSPSVSNFEAAGSADLVRTVAAVERLEPVSTGTVADIPNRPDAEKVEKAINTAEFVGPPLPPEPEVDVFTGKIKSGQTASSLLQDYLDPAEIFEADRTCREVFPLSRLRAGRPYCLETVDGRFKSFIYEIDGDEKLVLSREGENFKAESQPIEYEIETRVVHGEIDSSLFEAVDDAGENPSLAVRLSEIFAWDIDFVRDIRRGDSFRVVVEKRYRDGEFAGYGGIPAAMFVNRGYEFKGFLYADNSGRPAYFDEKGRSLRKTFLKAPLSFTRISSGYSLSRLHPVLKIRRPHQGIDYAAPRGTPVKAVGDGVVIKAAWDRGGGRFVKVRHNSVYETTYMHLSKFARGIKNGKRVSQGQVIGYVGSTGLSTGPHLDFRMKKNGSYVNPRTIESPPCEPIPEKKMGDFLAAISEVRVRLENGGLMHADASVESRTSIQ